MDTIPVSEKIWCLFRSRPPLMTTSLQIPHRRDPRWLFAGLLTCYAVAGSMVLGMNRDLWL